MTDPHAPRPSGWMSETLLLAALPVVAYAMAYGYEVGAAEFYGYPDWAIRLDLRNILGMGFLILAGLPVLASIPYLVGQILPASFATLVPYFGFFVGQCIVAVFMYGLSREVPSVRVPPWLVLGYLILAACALVGSVAVPIIRRDYRGLPLVARYERAANAMRERRQRAEEPPSLARLVQSRYWWIKGLAVVVAAMLTTVMTMIVIGHLSARMQVTYWVSDTSPALVALRSYGDVVVAVPLQADSSVRQDFHLLNPNGGREFIWRRMSIGPLRVVRHD